MIKVSRSTFKSTSIGANSSKSLPFWFYPDIPFLSIPLLFLYFPSYLPVDCRSRIEDNLLMIFLLSICKSFHKNFQITLRLCLPPVEVFFSTSQNFSSKIASVDFHFRTNRNGSTICLFLPKRKRFDKMLVQLLFCTNRKIRQRVGAPSHFVLFSFYYPESTFVGTPSLQLLFFSENFVTAVLFSA